MTEPTRPDGSEVAAPGPASGGPEARRDTSTLLLDGFQAGGGAALLVALWFLVLDLAAGQPLHAPELLGTALLEGPAAAAHVEEAHSVTVTVYSLFHLTLFVAFGTLLFWAVERTKGTGTAAVVLGAAFLLLALGPWAALQAAWPAVAAELGTWKLLIGGALTGAGMLWFVRIRTPGLTGRTA